LSNVYPTTSFVARGGHRDKQTTHTWGLTSQNDVACHPPNGQPVIPNHITADGGVIRSLVPLDHGWILCDAQANQEFYNSESTLPQGMCGDFHRPDQSWMGHRSPVSTPYAVWTVVEGTTWLSVILAWDFKMCLLYSFCTANLATQPTDVNVIGLHLADTSFRRRPLMVSSLRPLLIFGNLSEEHMSGHHASRLDDDPADLHDGQTYALRWGYQVGDKIYWPPGKQF
jgi:hypothetical protein